MSSSGRAIRLLWKVKHLAVELINLVVVCDGSKYNAYCLLYNRGSLLHHLKLKGSCQFMDRCERYHDAGASVKALEHDAETGTSKMLGATAGLVVPPGSFFFIGGFWGQCFSQTKKYLAFAISKSLRGGITASHFCLSGSFLGSLNTLHFDKGS